MNKSVFLIFYEKTVKELGEKLASSNQNFHFTDNPNSLYEEYLNQRAMLRLLYQKKDGEEKALLDRHKVCACMTAAIIKVRLLSISLDSDESYNISVMSRANEQLAFMSSWELLLGFLRVKRKNEESSKPQLPQTFHNNSFLDTITRSLFMANQMNMVSTPLLANIFFLLEKYNEEKIERTND